MKDVEWRETPGLGDEVLGYVSRDVQTWRALEAQRPNAEVEFDSLRAHTAYIRDKIIHEAQQLHPDEPVTHPYDRLPDDERDKMYRLKELRYQLEDTDDARRGHTVELPGTKIHISVIAQGVREQLRIRNLPVEIGEVRAGHLKRLSTSPKTGGSAVVHTGRRHSTIYGLVAEDGAPRVKLIVQELHDTNDS